MSVLMYDPHTASENHFAHKIDVIRGWHIVLYYDMCVHTYTYLFTTLSARFKKPLYMPVERRKKQDWTITS